MKSKFIIGFLCFMAAGISTNAQDSAKVAKALNDLALICRSMDFSDPKVQELGLFYKAAPYIVYQGDDKKRKWKDVANYRDPKEKQQVDDVCFRINTTLNQDTAYRILRYTTQKESEGVWYVLTVAYKRSGQLRQSSFAFLKIGNRFALGDID